MLSDSELDKCNCTLSDNPLIPINYMLQYRHFVASKSSFHGPTEHAGESFATSAGKKIIKGTNVDT